MKLDLVATGRPCDVCAEASPNRVMAPDGYADTPGPYIAELCLRDGLPIAVGRVTSSAHSAARYHIVEAFRGSVPGARDYGVACARCIRAAVATAADSDKTGLEVLMLMIQLRLAPSLPDAEDNRYGVERQLDCPNHHSER